MRSCEYEQENFIAESEYYLPEETIMPELARLPLREQRILLLHVLDKLRFSDIATVLGMSECAAQKAYQRTITLLRGRLGAHR